MRPEASDRVLANPDDTDLLKVAIRAAWKGSSEIARSQSPAAGLCNRPASGPVTDADRASESAIKRLIVAERPHDGVLGEEGGDRPPDSGLRWVIDPLDGTVNYLYRIPHWSVSIACERAGDDGWQAIVGVVHDVVRGETFTAFQGGDARLNGRAITVSHRVDLSFAVIGTEFAYGSASRARQAAVLADLLPRVCDIRTTGSSALDLCWTAAGRFDGFYEDELFPWDWSAGALIVQAAGGRVSRFGTGVVAGGPAVHRDLLALLTRR